MILHTMDADIEYYGKMKELEEKESREYPQDGMKELEEKAGVEFYRTHRSFLVNFEYIRKYDTATVYLEKGRALMANNIIRGL